MRWFVMALALGWALGGGTAQAETAPPHPILSEDLVWSSPPALPALRSAWVLGGEAQTGPYLLRVRLAPGGVIPPHVHPDSRITTVLSGTLSVIFGTSPDEGTPVALPPGGVYVAPAGVCHTLRARDGEVLYQESGTGPTGTTFYHP